MKCMLTVSKHIGQYLAVLNGGAISTAGIGEMLQTAVKMLSSNFVCCDVDPEKKRLWRDRTSQQRKENSVLAIQQR